MIKIVPFLIFLFSSFLCAANDKDSTLFYPVAIKFQSICCGVPSASPLEKMISIFKRKQHLKKISAYKISPLGREGEYVLAFSLSEMNLKKRQKFIGKIKSIVPTMRDKGNAEFELNYSTSTSSLPSRATIEKIIY